MGKAIITLLIMIVLSGCAVKKYAERPGVWSRGFVSLAYGEDWDYVGDKNGVSYFKHDSGYVSGMIYFRNKPISLDMAVSAFLDEKKNTLRKLSIHHKSYPIIQDRQVCHIGTFDIKNEYIYYSTESYVYAGNDGVVIVVAYMSPEAPHELDKIPRQFIDGLTFKN